MPYLDEDILYNNVEEKYKSAKGKAREAYSDVLDTICEMPRADVVPKSEVESLAKEVDRLSQVVLYNDSVTQMLVEEAKEKVAREIFEEIEGSIAVHAFTSKSEDYADGMYDAIEWVDSKIAELKKKYTEGNNEES